jgi:hypothetical protein
MKTSQQENPLILDPESLGNKPPKKWSTIKKIKTNDNLKENKMHN